MNLVFPHFGTQLPILDGQDAALIVRCNSNSRHIRSHQHEFNDLTGIAYDEGNPNEEYFRQFIRHFLPSPLRHHLLINTPINTLENCYSILLRHNCNIENSCRIHLYLLLKLRIIAAPSLSFNTLYTDFNLFVKYRYDWNLMLCYFKKFVTPDNLTHILMVLPPNAIHYFMTTASQNFYLHFLSWIDTIIHFFVNNVLCEKIKFFITYGARNLDSQDVYETYSSPLMIYPQLPVDSRIKMRALQIYLIANHENAVTLQMLMAANMEPFLTRQQYQAVCNEFAPYMAGDPNWQVELEQSWVCYRTVFGIQDNAPVTPRPLQHICRYLIRLNMARNRQLPHGVEQLPTSTEIKNYIALIDWEIPVGEEVHLF